MSIYVFFKLLHVISAVISFAGFFIRGIWMIRSSDYLQLRWVKIVPHIIDTILLLSAIGLVMVTARYPGAEGWLNAKIAGLIIYIVLGSIALKYGASKTTRIIAWVGALIAFAYIVSVALNKSALSVF